MIQPQPRLPTQSDRQLFRKHFLLVLLFWLWFVTNFLFSWFAELGPKYSLRAIVTWGSLGLIASQPALTGFFLVFFPASIFFRSVLCLIAMTCISVSMMLGNFLFDNFRTSEQLELISLLPAVVIGFAAPFAAAKHYLKPGWRLEFDGFEPAENNGLSVGSLMISTAMCAFAIALLGASGETNLYRGVMLLALSTGATMLFVFPATLIVGWTQHGLRASIALLVIGVGSFGLTFVLISVVELIAGSTRFWIKFGVAVQIMSFVLSFSTALLILFRSGGALRFTDTTANRRTWGKWAAPRHADAIGEIGKNG